MAEATIPELRIGTRYPDRYTDGFEWEATEIDGAPDLVRLVGYSDGEETGGVLDWPRNRWYVLWDRQMFEAPRS